jgi:hypothetical protein
MRPPLEHFLNALGEERLWGEVWVRRVGQGFELRHQADRAAPGSDLRDVDVTELRALSMGLTPETFRPLRTAPGLPSGWRRVAPDAPALEEALEAIYPGTLADAWAAASGKAQPANFRDFARDVPGRKSAELLALSGEALMSAARIGCGPGACVRQRLWSDADVPPETEDGRKSAIPCLEPCPVFVSFAARCSRMEEGPCVALWLSAPALATVRAALEAATRRAPSGLRRAEFGAPLHPQRVAYVLERQGAAFATNITQENSDES